VSVLSNVLTRLGKNSLAVIRQELEMADQTGLGIAQEVVPGATWAEKLDPMQLIQMLQQILGGGQGPWAPGGRPTDPGGSALKEQMMRQQINQLSGQGGMGY
jgi:hypothetical protein